MKKKILILGSNGYIGSKLSITLNKKFKIYKLPNKKKTFSLIKKSLVKNKIGIIVNLVNNDNHREKIIKFNEDLLKAIKDLDVKIIFVSTSLIYGLNNKPADEKTKLKPFNDYTYNKFIIEKLYENSKTNFKIIRLSNVYDDKLNKKGIFKNLINCVKKKNIYIKFNNLEIYRNFIHLNDVMNMMEKLLVNYEKINQKIFNFGGENLKLKKIIYLFNKKFSTKINIKINKKKTYDPSIKINSNLSRKILKYNKFIKLSSTLEKFKNSNIYE